MNPVTVITSALQSIPPQVRKWLLLVYSIVVVVIGLLSVLGVDLDYDKITVVLTALGGYLGFQSVANVPAAGEGERVAPPPEPTVPEQRGEEDGTPN